MALDSFFISALASELDRELSGQKIVKIFMPEKNKILLHLYGAQGNRRLLISAGAGNARIYFTETEYENPSDPPMFCMLLRKYLTGAVITDVYQMERDRIIGLSLTGRDALGETEELRIVLEMLGNSSNLMLLDRDGMIIDALIRTGYKNDRARCINPGAPYLSPARQNRTDFFKADSHEVEMLCSRADKDVPASDWLLTAFLGFSPLLCRELAYRAANSYDLLPDVLSDFRLQCETGAYVPYIYVKDGRFSELSSYELTHLGNGASRIVCEGFSEAMRRFYAEKDAEDRRRNLSGSLRKQVKNIRGRIAKKIAIQTDQLKATENAEETRKAAEFILANIYRIKIGDTLLKCPDYYSEDGTETEIPLDPLKSPQQNAAVLYKDYNRKKKAALVLRDMLEKERLELEYLDSVADEINRAETLADISEIRTELSAAGFIREKAKGKNRKQKLTGPLSFKSADGFVILVGRNNLQNDELTFRQARKTDWWFHVKNYHGSHVILSCEGAQPEAETITEAAEYALRFSEAAGSGKQAVDYTRVSNVSKPSGALPGRVIYRNYKTVIVSDDGNKK
ncbi:MAG: NFACT family protein [Oscillospiraceae bacterium]|nr:NFACT family protein [Oscillospiraceae bacterium]